MNELVDGWMDGSCRGAPLEGGTAGRQATDGSVGLSVGGLCAQAHRTSTSPGLLRVRHESTCVLLACLLAYLPSSTGEEIVS